MEQLSQSVYECTLAVEAHMVCDLLSQAGIAARVDGEFLTGAGGDLPLGNTVKVRVAPARAAEAREVIAEWEKTQTGDKVPPVTAAPRFKFLLWFLAGATVGMILSVIGLRVDSRFNGWGVDYDGDGRDDSLYYYKGDLPTWTTHDRNNDGYADALWNYDVKGLPLGYKADDDFDGEFEWTSNVKLGEVSLSMLDADRDGRPEQLRHFRNGVLLRADYYFANGDRVVKLEHYQAGLLVSAEYDEDGDGLFERRVSFDRHGEPISPGM